jgi:hypothetical protein
MTACHLLVQGVVAMVGAETVAGWHLSWPAHGQPMAKTRPTHDPRMASLHSYVNARSAQRPPDGQHICQRRGQHTTNLQDQHARESTHSAAAHLDLKTRFYMALFCTLLAVLCDQAITSLFTADFAVVHHCAWASAGRMDRASAQGKRKRVYSRGSGHGLRR